MRILLTCLVGLCLFGVRLCAQAPVVVTRLQTDKVRYRQGEAGKLALTLSNATGVTQVVNVAGELVQELELCKPLPGCAFTIPPLGEVSEEFSFIAPAHDYGCAVRVRVVQNGKVLTSAQEMFNVAANVWSVAIGADLPMMSMSGFPWIDPKSDIELARRNYFNWWEKMFWPPDDFGDMTPEAEKWWSGQGGRYEIKKVIKASTALAKANGIASITYGKSTSGGPAGWELCRCHPNWFKQDDSGRPYGIFDTAVFANWEKMDAFKGQRGWYYLYPNVNRLDTLDWGIDQLIASAREYGWDGVRFDGDFTWVANDEVGARNQRRMKERIWATLPDYVFGYNISFSPTDETPDRWSHALCEGLAGGGHYMHEAIRNYAYATNGRYTSYRDYWGREARACDHIRQLGASYHFIYDLNHLKSPEQKIYKFILGTSAGAHPVYGDSTIATGCANWGRFLTRWSAFVWDTNLRVCPDADAQVTGSAPLWQAVKERVVDAKTKDTIVHLIVPPTVDNVDTPGITGAPPVKPVVATPISPDEVPVENGVKAPVPVYLRIGEAATGVTVRVRIPTSEQVVRAAAIAPEHPDDALALAVTREGAWAKVTVPEVRLFTLVVFERVGTYAVPVYSRYTALPDAAKVKEGVEAGNGKLARDPMRPEAVTEIVQRVRTIVLAHTYLTHAIVEPDPEASEGTCIRMDYSMSNSTLIDHAIFNNVRPGHYRASYRLKLKSKTDVAGKAIWAGFGFYVQLGKKEKWLREIGPKDFTSPGKYEDFTVEFDFLGESSNIGVNAFWRGQQAGGTVYGDYVTLEQMSSFSDADIAARVKYVPDTVHSPGGAAGLEVLVVNGLYNEQYRLPEALALFGPVNILVDAAQQMPDNPDIEPNAEVNLTGNNAVSVRYATVNVGEGTFTLSNFPKSYAALCQYHLVVLVNIDASWLQFTGRAWLRDFVNAGGGLLVLGGNFTLAQGAFAGTFLADLLPVTVSRGRDLITETAVLKPQGMRDALTAALWQLSPALFWRHAAVPKPGARVQLLAGTDPVLLTHTFGKGRVAVFTGAVLGNPIGKELPFWKWISWPQVMNTTMKELAGWKEK